MTNCVRQMQTGQVQMKGPEEEDDGERKTHPKADQIEMGAAVHDERTGHSFRRHGPLYRRNEETRAPGLRGDDEFDLRGGKETSHEDSHRCGSAAVVGSMIDSPFVN